MMGNDILTEVISVEKDIQGRLAAERELAAQVLAGAENAVMEEMTRAEQELKTSYEKSLQEANLLAGQKARQLIEASEELAEKLRKLDEETIRKILSRHIGQLLPQGALRDSEDVKS